MQEISSQNKEEEMKRNEIQEQLNACEAHLLELKQILASSDEHALKCFKKGLIFEEEYPEEASVYEAARLEYNSTEAEIDNLRTMLDVAIKEEEEEAHKEEE